MMFTSSGKSLILAMLAMAAINHWSFAGRELRSANGTAAADGAVSGNHSIASQGEEVLQRLRICNAYAWPTALDVYHVRPLQVITGDRPLKYKDCRDFSLPLVVGDELDFKAGDLDVGTFTAKSLPTFSATLLLIPRHVDEDSGAVTFESHAFVDIDSPQMAIVDAYRGKETGSVRIAEPSTGAQRDMAEAEELSFNTVLAFNPGQYEIALVGSRGDAGAPEMIDMQSQAKFVVVRVGGTTAKVVNKNNQEEIVHYPEEMLVFPQLERAGSTATRLRDLASGAVQHVSSFFGTLV